MRVLWAHGTLTASLHDIFQATVVSRIQYGSQAWSGMCLVADHVCLDSLLHRGKQLGYCAVQTMCRPSLTYLTPQTTTSSTTWKPTLTTSFSLTSQTRVTYRTSFKSVHTTCLSLTRQNFLMIQTLSSVWSISTPTNPMDPLTVSHCMLYHLSVLLYGCIWQPVLNEYRGMLCYVMLCIGDSTE